MITQCGTLLIFLGLTYLSAASQIAPRSGTQVRIGNTLYFIEKTLKNWFDARKSCEKMGYKLISLDTKQKFDDINNHLDNEKDEEAYWTSGNDFLTLDQHIWFPSGTAVPSNYWSPNEPNNQNYYEHCDEFRYEKTHLMNDADCVSFRYYICELTLGVHHTSNGISPGHCLPFRRRSYYRGKKNAANQIAPRTATQTLIDNTLYFIENNITRNWYEARRSCEKMGYKLISLDTKQKSVDINHHLDYEGASFDYAYWTSGNDFFTLGRHLWFPSGTAVPSNYWHPDYNYYICELTLGAPDNSPGHCLPFRRRSYYRGKKTGNKVSRFNPKKDF